jgi:diguanylate cyclase (GGDEF)-like protein/PAS domain S-box-containing protein
VSTLSGRLGEAFSAAPGAGEEERRAQMARALFAMFALGAVLALVAIPLSSYLTTEDQILLVVTVGAAVGVAALIARAWRRMPEWVFGALLALGTLITGLGMYLTQPVQGDTAMFYVWVVLFAAYFFTRVAALIQLGIIGISYGVVLAIDGGMGGPARWLITMGTLVLVGVLVVALKEIAIRRIEERRRSERKLEESVSLMEATLQSTADGMLVVDRAGAIVSFNRTFQEMWRIPDDVVKSEDDDQALGFALEQLTEPDQVLAKVRELYRRPEAESYDVLTFKDGRVFERYSRPQRGSDGQVFGRVWSFRDVTEREKARLKLQDLADHDPLTGLLNRRRFEEELSRHISRASRYGNGGAVLVVDLDDLKDVNDSHGHRTGDALIRSVADLLRDRLRHSDVLARLGGDEFAVLLPRVEPEEARLTAENLLDAVRRHRATFRGKRVRVTTSIGVAPILEPDAQTAEDVLGQADGAMYRAKEAGRDGLAVHSPEEPRVRRESWPERIRTALEDNRLILYVQPILDLRTNEISQYELLVRMIGEDGEVLPPGAFLGSAERVGLIQQIDAWVARSAIRLIDQHRRAGRELRLEVNLSGRTMGDPGLLEAIAGELEAALIDPANVIFEVTETAAIASMDDAREFASALTELGCRFALDDFGAGFSSFYYLKYLPLDFLKIDGDFITNLAGSPTDQAVVKAIVELSRSLGKQTIAEFVGDAPTLELLREYGVDYGQGYHIGRPQPVSEMWADVRATPLVEAGARI